MRLEQIALCGGGRLTCYLRTPSESMAQVRRRPAVVVIPGGGYNICGGMEPLLGYLHCSPQDMR